MTPRSEGFGDSLHSGHSASDVAGSRHGGHRWLIISSLLLSGVVGIGLAIYLSSPPNVAVLNDINLGGVDAANYQQPSPASPADAAIAVSQFDAAAATPSQPLTKMVRVVSEPVGAQVTVDGTMIGTTPIDVAIPSSGRNAPASLRLELNLPGYQIERRTIADSATSPVRFVLLRKKTAKPPTPSERPTPREQPVVPEVVKPPVSSPTKHDKDGLMNPGED